MSTRRRDSDIFSSTSLPYKGLAEEVSTELGWRQKENYDDEETSREVYAERMVDRL